VLQTSSALCDSGTIRLADLPAEVRDYLAPVAAPAGAGNAAPAAPAAAHGNGAPQGSLPAAAAPAATGNDAGEGWSFLDRAERDALLDLLRRHRWNVTNVATELGVSRNTVYRKTNRFGLVRE